MAKICSSDKMSVQKNILLIGNGYMPLQCMRKTAMSQRTGGHIPREKFSCLV